MPSPKPLVLITGFLGAGKTRVLRRLLTGLSQQGLSADVILNDIVNAELDVASIDPRKAASITPLAAGCACCDSFDDLVRLCRRASTGQGDLLLIELNGTADPLGLLESFSVLRREMHFSPMLQLGVVDVRHWGKRGDLTPLEKRQMEGAGLHLLSHQDLADDGEIHRTSSLIEMTYPGSTAVTVEALIDALATGVAFPATGGSGPQRDREKEHGVDGTSERARDPVHLLSHQMTGLQLVLPSKVRRGSIERLLANLPKSVLRAKALVRLVEEPGSRWLFEKSGAAVSKAPLPVHGLFHVPSNLLCMGIQLDEACLRGHIIDEFGPIASTGVEAAFD